MQKANPICGPNFDNGSTQRNVAINIDAGRNFLPEFFLIRKQAASVRLLSFSEISFSGVLSPARKD